MRVSAILTLEGTFNYKVVFEPLDLSQNDTVCRFGEVQVLVYSPHLDRLKGSRVDFIEGTGFVVENPNASNKEMVGRLEYEHELKRFGLLYHEYAASHGKGPLGLKDFEKDRDRFPRVYANVQAGNFVVAWDVALRSSAEEGHKYWLGYEIGVPQNGGIVLLGDGAVEMVTKEQFEKLLAFTNGLTDK